MAAINYPVVGPPKPSPAPADGSVPLRLEVRQLQKNADLWNLYLLGLDAFKNNTDETKDLSYYGIAGIHGRPYRPWGGVKGQNRAGWQGYCTHTDILFAPWHRPYLVLFEQVLFNAIQDIAAKFPADTRARYQKAALSFRIPYWDWAAQPDAGDYFPNSVGGSATVQVITPTSNGQPVTIDNPLYTTKFHPLNPVAGDFISSGGSPFNKWISTLRYPSNPRSVSATSQEDQVFAALESQFAGLQQNVNILLNDPNYTDFAAFSNHEWQTNSPGTYASIEDIHNSIHGMVGGNNGHMAELDYSAFDPVFWLHHANVDRIFAIWQALNPNSYTINKVSADGTFAIAENTPETPATALVPFADATGHSYWTPENIRNTQTFNYAYPETQSWQFSSASQYEDSVAQAVQNLYGGLSSQFGQFSTMATPSDGAQKVVEREIAAPAPAPVPAASSAAPAATAHATEPHGFNPLHDLANKMKDVFHHGQKAPDTTARALDLEAEIGKPTKITGEAKAASYTEYIVNIKAPKHLLGQTYRVHIFLGAFDPELRTWHTQEALVGTFAVFGKNTAADSPESTGCGKCRTDAERSCEVTGTVPLTSQILSEVQKGNCPGMDKENVLPFLTNNLHWRVTLADGSEKERSEVEGLVISLVTTEVVIPPGGGRPRYTGVYTLHPEVTEGRPAGYDEGAGVTRVGA